MTAGKKIIVAVRDAETGRLALKRALSLASSPHDSIHLLHASRMASMKRVMELLARQWTPDDDEDNKQDEHAWLQGLAETAGPDGPKVTFELVNGEPGTVIVESAVQRQADLIVVAMPREGQVRQFFIGSTALRILRTAPCPVVVARGQINTNYQRALIAVDLDDAGQRLLQAAGVWLANAKIDLVHAYRLEHEGRLRMRGRVTEEEILKLREFERLERDEKLNVYRAQLPDATVHLEHGWANTVILDVATRLKPDILVLSKHRGTNSDERIFGSVTQFLLYEFPSDILLAP